MANKPYYTEEMKDEFIALAQLKGISPAIRELKWPSFPTAQKWFRERDLDMPTIDTLMAKAAELKVFYSDNEKKYAVQALMDRIVEKLHEDDLDADSINKLGNALAKAIQTFQLIDGKATAITQSKAEPSDPLEAIDLINAAKARNALAENELS